MFFTLVSSRRTKELPEGRHIEFIFVPRLPSKEKGTNDLESQVDTELSFEQENIFWTLKHFLKSTHHWLRIDEVLDSCHSMTFNFEATFANML